MRIALYLVSQQQNAAAVEARRHPVSFSTKQGQNKLAEHRLKLKRDTKRFLSDWVDESQPSAQEEFQYGGTAGRIVASKVVKGGSWSRPVHYGRGGCSWSKSEHATHRRRPVSAHLLHAGTSILPPFTSFLPPFTSILPPFTSILPPFTSILHHLPAPI